MSECYICLEEAEVPAALKCGHVFCLECLEEWLEISRTCPNCRYDIPTNERPLLLHLGDPLQCQNDSNDDKELDEKLKNLRLLRCKKRKTFTNSRIQETRFDSGQAYLAEKNIKFNLKLQEGNYPLFKSIRHRGKYLLNAQYKAQGKLISAKSGDGTTLVIMENDIPVGSLNYSKDGWKPIGDTPHPAVIEAGNMLKDCKPQIVEQYLDPTTGPDSFENGLIRTEETTVTIPEDLTTKTPTKPEQWKLSSKHACKEIGIAAAGAACSGFIISLYYNWDDFKDEATRWQATKNVAMGTAACGGVGCAIRGTQMGLKHSGIMVKNLGTTSSSKLIQHFGNGLTRAGKALPFAIPISLLAYQISTLVKSYNNKEITFAQLRDQSLALVGSQAGGAVGMVGAGLLCANMTTILGPLLLAVGLSTGGSILGEWAIKSLLNKYTSEKRLQESCEVLGLQSDGLTRAELRRKFARLALKHHPDRIGNTSDSNLKMINLLLAYETVREIKGWE